MDSSDADASAKRTLWPSKKKGSFTQDCPVNANACVFLELLLLIKTFPFVFQVSSTWSFLADLGMKGKILPQTEVDLPHCVLRNLVTILKINYNVFTLIFMDYINAQSLIFLQLIMFI